MIPIVADNENEGSYGIWECPKKGTKFYGGGPPCCGCDTYKDHIYHYTRQEAEMVKERGNSPLTPVGVVRQLLELQQGTDEAQIEVLAIQEKLHAG